MIALLNNFELRASALPADFEKVLPQLAAKRLGIPVDAVNALELLSCSVDSRRGEPKMLFALKLELDDRCSAKVVPASPEELAALAIPEPEIPENTHLLHPVVVGTGPAGIFGALVLAMAGCRPLVIDRGAPVAERERDYEEFLHTRTLDEESNLLIGEGGAGTFSDGKLYTGTRDLRGQWVKREMVRAGAPPEILWRARAHIGSDCLGKIAANLRRRIETLGGKFLFHTEISDVKVVNHRCCGVITASGEVIDAPLVLMAPGLGGRALTRQLTKRAAWQLKGFQTGCRIEHPQRIIDKAMYHVLPRPAALGAAEYHLVSRRGPLNVSSFCMCPGGEVVNATAWQNHAVTNGMSRFARSGEFADSCLIVTLDPAQWGSLEAVDECFDALEQNIFRAGGSDYAFPAQDAAAFAAHRAGLTRKQSSCRTGIVPGRVDELLLPQVRDSLANAVRELDRRIPGFAREGVVIGAESFVSSPLRFERLPGGESVSTPGIWFSGEGCGAAGGIISAACDGIRCALSMLGAD